MVHLCISKTKFWERNLNLKYFGKWNFNMVLWIGYNYKIQAFHEVHDLNGKNIVDTILPTQIWSFKNKIKYSNL